MPTRVRPEAPAQRPPVQTRRRRVQGGAPDPHRARQGQEPVAQCGLPLWRPSTVLRAEGDELLHGDVRRVARARRARADGVVARARPAHRAAQVSQHRHAHQAARQVTATTPTIHNDHSVQ